MPYTFAHNHQIDEYIMPYGFDRACLAIRPNLDSIEFSHNPNPFTEFWYSAIEGNREWCSSDPNALLEMLRHDDQAYEVEEAA